MEKKPNFKLEYEIFSAGYRYLAGIDEVGYGSLAGPVCVGCVVFENKNLSKWLKIGIKDSKKLSASKREKLFKWIIDNVLDWSVAFVSARVIDEINIKEATMLAAKNALKMLEVKPDFILIDGVNRIKYLRIPQKTIIKGDEKSITIASSSIVAKVLRDCLMLKIQRHYKNYGFARNKGYGTKFHLQALNKYGKLSLHRHSFCKFLYEKGSLEGANLKNIKRTY